MTQFVQRGSFRMHYLEHPGPEPAMVLIHGLTANAHCFDGLIGAGLSEFRACLAVDLRGRGLSDQPAHGYTPADHAADIIALLDHRGIDQAVICGHSYGGLIGLELASQYPARVSKLVVIDICGPSIHNPAVLELIKPSLDRLGQVSPSLEAFLDQMKRLPFLRAVWDEALEAYYRADVEPLGDRQVRVRASPAVIQQVITEGQQVDWEQRFQNARQPTMLLHASEPFGDSDAAPIVPESQAHEAVELLPEGRYVHVPGNHMTMMFGANAGQMVAEIRHFISA